jgi:hypothetical protein
MFQICQKLKRGLFIYESSDIHRTNPTSNHTIVRALPPHRRGFATHRRGFATPSSRLCHLIVVALPPIVAALPLHHRGFAAGCAERLRLSGKLFYLFGAAPYLFASRA